MIKKLQLLLIFIVFISFIDFSYSQTKNQNQIKINVVYLSGEVKIENTPAKLNQSVLVNQKIQTGNDGHIYLKSADNGFLVLRPNSTAFIRAYSVDAKNPQNNRIKIELENGVARHISGEAVKSSRQNFRFNTPVAAIGVRGTDFVVFTNINESRIAVSSGGIAISPFNKTCQADGFGACQGKSVMELFANADGNSQLSKILEVSANDKIPRLLENITDKRLQTNEQENQNIENSIINSNSNVPAETTTPTPEPTSSENATEHNQDVKVSTNSENTENTENTEKNNQNLVENQQTSANSANSANTENTKKDKQNLAKNSQNSQTTPQNNNSSSEQTPADNIDNSNSESLIPAKVENAVDNTKSTIHWGRWKEIAEDKPVQIDLQNINSNETDFVAKNDYFAIFRDKGEWQKPLNDLQFSLINSEAVLRERNGNISEAIVRSGNLNIDIARQRFSSDLAVEYTLSNQNKNFVQQFRAVGNLSEQGTFDSLAGISGSTMTTKGALSHDNNEAAYIFQGRTLSNYSSPNNQIFGVTQWGIKK